MNEKTSKIQREHNIGKRQEGKIKSAQLMNMEREWWHKGQLHEKKTQKRKNSKLPLFTKMTEFTVKNCRD